MGKCDGHFLLVHGSCHGAWCWYKVATLLKSSGHRVTALDMAASGIHNKKKVEELCSVTDYFEPLMEFVAALPPEEKVVLVGHSRGGVGISLAMEKFPEKIAVAVFVAATMFGPNHDLPSVYQKLIPQIGSSMDNHFSHDNGPEKPPTSVLFGAKFLETKLYQLSPPENLTLATMLMRPVPLYEDEQLLKETIVTKEKYGSVTRVYVLLEKDNVMKEDAQKWMIENEPTDEVMMISNADHMVMFSKPQELSSCLQSIAQKYLY